MIHRGVIGQHVCSSNIRVPGEGDLARGRKNSHACRTGGIVWRQNERGFAVAKFNGDLLHLCFAHTLRIEYDGDRVTLKRGVSKNIRNNIASLHFLSGVKILT